ncbi:nitroreductase family protein [Anaerohalosphaera lusitana]|nr:nitroreductase family protein [Anaerohalosphaera lusitana]
MNLLTEFERTGGDTSRSQYKAACNVLKAYVGSGQIQSSDDTQLLVADIKSFLEGKPTDNCRFFAGGVRILSKTDCIEASRGDFRKLSQNRYSIRTFAGGNVPMSKIYDAVEMAQKSPSTCNRQTSRVYVYSKKNTINEILAIHKGTRGFTEQIDKFILVAGDQKCCLGVGDRNQVYVDCGIFAMSLLYGLQYNRLGACILHWNVTPKKDLQLRKVAGVADNHTVVCMIAVGRLAEEFKVPVSQRRNLKSICFAMD